MNGQGSTTPTLNTLLTKANKKELGMDRHLAAYYFLLHEGKDPNGTLMKELSNVPELKRAMNNRYKSSRNRNDYKNAVKQDILRVQGSSLFNGAALNNQMTSVLKHMAATKAAIGVMEKFSMNPAGNAGNGIRSGNNNAVGRASAAGMTKNDLNRMLTTYISSPNNQSSYNALANSVAEYYDIGVNKLNKSKLKEAVNGESFTFPNKNDQDFKNIITKANNNTAVTGGAAVTGNNKSNLNKNLAAYRNANINNKSSKLNTLARSVAAYYGIKVNQNKLNGVVSDDGFAFPNKNNAQNFVNSIISNNP